MAGIKAYHTDKGVTIMNFQQAMVLYIEGEKVRMKNGNRSFLFQSMAQESSHGHF